MKRMLLMAFFLVCGSWVDGMGLAEEVRPLHGVGVTTEFSFIDQDDYNRQIVVRPTYRRYVGTLINRVTVSGEFWWDRYDDELSERLESKSTITETPLIANRKAYLLSLSGDIGFSPHFTLIPMIYSGFLDRESIAGLGLGFRLGQEDGVNLLIHLAVISKWGFRIEGTLSDPITSNLTVKLHNRIDSFSRGYDDSDIVERLGLGVEYKRGSFSVMPMIGLAANSVENLGVFSAFSVNFN